jgi:hypothetical protein
VQFLASGSESDAAARSIEEVNAQPRLQSFERMTECRCTDAEFQTGSTKAAVLRKCEKIGEIREIVAIDTHAPDSAWPAVPGNHVESYSTLIVCPSMALEP